MYILQILMQLLIQIFFLAQKVYPCTVLCVWYFKSLEKSANTYLKQCSQLDVCIYYTHTHTPMYTLPNKLSLCIFPVKDIQRSLIWGWLDLVSNLQKPIIMLTTNRSFHRMLRGRENMHRTVKMAHTGAELFLPTPQNLMLSNCK